jgi:hypothetical protein
MFSRVPIVIGQLLRHAKEPKEPFVGVSLEWLFSSFPSQQVLKHPSLEATQIHNSLLEMDKG